MLSVCQKQQHQQWQKQQLYQKNNGTRIIDRINFEIKYIVSNISKIRWAFQKFRDNYSFSNKDKKDIYYMQMKQEF